MSFDRDSFWIAIQIRTAGTNLTAPNRAVARFYNKRGMAEQRIKEGMQAVAMKRLSCHRFRGQ
jgi:hypothetical protein